jgi:large repetitive protein
MRVAVRPWAVGVLGLCACLGEPLVPAPGGDPGHPVVYPVGGTTLAGLAALDVVGDSRRDLVAVARGDLTIRILPGGDAGQFAAALSFAAGNDARRATAGDVNGDGIPDLLVIGHDNVLILRLGLGGGRFADGTRYPLRNHGNFLVVADLNGDAFDDVAAVHDGSGNPVYVTTFLGSASGELHQASELGTPYFTSMGAAAGDFDADGRTDLAVAVGGDNRASVLVFRGQGTGEFAAPVVLPTVSPDSLISDGTSAVAVGDLNGDGRDDLVVACFELSNQLVIRLSTEAGFADPVQIELPSPVAVALGDVNGDGKLDAVASNLAHGSLSLLLGRGDGSFEEPTTVSVGPEPTSLAVADFDDNGSADIAVTDLGDHKIRVLLSPKGLSGATHSTIPVPIANTPANSGEMSERGQAASTMPALRQGRSPLPDKPLPIFTTHYRRRD